MFYRVVNNNDVLNIIPCYILIGLMKCSRGDLLPKDPNSKDRCKDRTGGCFLAGERRVNEHIGLMGLHTVFVRLHNIYAKRLSRLNRHWDSEKIFQETRKIIIALYQNIVYHEYLPTLVSIRRYRGYKKRTDPRVAKVFSAVAFRYGHTQIKNSWGRLSNGFNLLLPNLPLRETFFNNTEAVTNGIEPVFFGLLGNLSEEVDTKFASTLLNKLFIPPGEEGFQNLLALNIQRAREQGIRGYNDWRKFCGLKRMKTFRGYKREIVSVNLRKKLKSLYKSTRNHVDLFPAGLAEKPSKGKLIGPTFQCLIGKQFQNMRDGDRFWFERKGVFSESQLLQIRKMTMAKVLCLTLKGIVSIQKDVFEVFDAKRNRRVSCNCIAGLQTYAWRDHRRYYNRHYHG